jgi:hypothetical protein
MHRKMYLQNDLPREPRPAIGQFDRYFDFRPEDRPVFGSLGCFRPA